MFYENSIEGVRKFVSLAEKNTPYRAIRAKYIIKEGEFNKIKEFFTTYFYEERPTQGARRPIISDEYIIYGGIDDISTRWEVARYKSEARFIVISKDMIVCYGDYIEWLILSPDYNLAGLKGVRLLYANKEIFIECKQVKTRLLNNGS